MKISNNTASGTAIGTATSKLVNHQAIRPLLDSVYPQRQQRIAPSHWLEQALRTLEQQVKYMLETQPQAQVIWHGQLDQLEDSQNWQSQHPRLIKQFKQMKGHSPVIALDFGWNHFVTWMTYQGWGVIPNLHPSKSWQQHSSQLQQYLGRVGQLQGVVSRLGLQAHRQRITALLKVISTALAQENQYKKSVRQAMFVALETVCQDSTVIITETLDIHRLYQNPSKRRAIDDLDWWNLIAELQQRTTKNQQELVLLPRDYKSLTCPNCRHCSLTNRLHNGFRCQKCQSQVHPDIVALLNLWHEWLEIHDSKK
jgi:hypothetical protein